MVAVLQANTPVYASEDNTLIRLNVQFDHLPGFVPFTANANDPEPHGRYLHERAMAGDYGTIGPYVKPAGKVREDAYRADTARTEFIDQLRTASPDQIETFIRNKINVDAVTDLASAKQCMKRIETGIVTMMKLLALSIRQ